MPIISLFLGWILLGETEAYISIVGGIISVVGAFIISKYGLNKKHICITLAVGVVFVFAFSDGLLFHVASGNQWTSY